ncbi:hypothetical protein G6672_00180 [Polynucleobacter paneuropaeus]|nr:hypothetical protein [Polynucleobacter paneuropaeus]MBT8635671.1 hypothetical protein [Polynucleobacter paneuropaeus]MBT8637478.1 hypothetical protein [Polynucleobacter paneuropaeus]
MKFRGLLVAVGLAGLIGCANQFNTAQSNYDACNNSNPYQQYVDKSIIFTNLNSPNKYQLLASSRTLTPEQKDIFQRYLNYSSSCRSNFLRTMGGGSYQSSYITYFNRIDQIYANLMGGTITIGQANTQKTQAFEQLQISFRNINQQTAEANARAYQQYLDNQQREQAITNQTINSLQRSQPTQTYCQKDGYGNMSCQTY